MIGKLDKRIAVYQRGIGIDDFGGAVNEFSKVFECFASINKDKTGDFNKEVSGKQTGERSIAAVIRYRTGLNEAMIFSLDDELGLHYYKIEAINEVTSSRRKGYIKLEGVKFDINEKII
jgi:head-tail adaptor